MKLFSCFILNILCIGLGYYMFYGSIKELGIASAIALNILFIVELIVLDEI